MATDARGIVCRALTAERIAELNIPAMKQAGFKGRGVDFTIPIEAKRGVTTGISVFDRARTVAVAINEANGPDSIVSPGHVFPVATRPGGVLVRAGRSEAAVDITRLAGLNPSADFCGVMRDDGEMAGTEELDMLAREHDLKSHRSLI